jgi:hypothetical protein
MPPITSQREREGERERERERGEREVCAGERVGAGRKGRRGFRDSSVVKVRRPKPAKIG